MKRSWVLLLASLAVALGIFAHETTHGQTPGAKSGDLGPGEKGATLRLPGTDAPPTSLPASMQGLWNTPGAGPGTLTPIKPFRAVEPPSTATDINKDIELS